jgi:hypothetical protein
MFRQRFDDLRLKPFLDYASYRHIPGSGGTYRFTGGFESTDGHILWIRSENLTIPIMLDKAQTYILPMTEEYEILESFDPAEEAPERIRWDQIASLTEGTKVFVGGTLAFQDERWIFVSTKENPLLIIFYNGSDRSLTIRTIRAGRNKNEFWNTMTPYSFIIGAFCQFLIAVSFLSRPAFRLTSIIAFITLFTPLFPLFPPGILFTLLYRRLWWSARIFRAYRDILRLPLKYLPANTWNCLLPNGERYGAIVVYRSSAQETTENPVPLLIPDKTRWFRKGPGLKEWYLFGTLPDSPETDPQESLQPGKYPQFIPQEPQDAFATFGAVPGNPEALAKSYTVKAYILEIISCIFLFIGMGLNIFFIVIIISILL